MTLVMYFEAGEYYGKLPVDSCSLSLMHRIMCIIVAQVMKDAAEAQTGGD